MEGPRPPAGDGDGTLTGGGAVPAAESPGGPTGGFNRTPQRAHTLRPAPRFRIALGAAPGPRRSGISGADGPQPAGPPEHLRPQVESAEALGHSAGKGAAKQHPTNQDPAG